MDESPTDSRPSNGPGITKNGMGGGARNGRVTMPIVSFLSSLPGQAYRPPWNGSTAIRATRVGTAHSVPRVSVTFSVPFYFHLLE